MQEGKRKDFDISTLPVATYLANPQKYRSQADSYFNNNPWIDFVMKSRGWQWIVVCGGNVVGGSADIFDFPDTEGLYELAEKYGYIPFAYSADILPEEVAAGGI
jgi:hypothetical protein